MKPLYESNLILCKYGGSISYGTNLPSSGIEISEALLVDCQKRFSRAVKNTKLPKAPDIEKINELVKKINIMHLNRTGGVHA